MSASLFAPHVPCQIIINTRNYTNKEKNTYHVQSETVTIMSTGHQTNEQDRAALWSADELPRPVQTPPGLHLGTASMGLAVRRLRWALC